MKANQNNNLPITYQNQSNKTILCQEIMKIQQLQQIKSYCQEKPDKTVSSGELEQTKQQTNNPRCLPLVLGEVVGLELIGIMVYFLTRKEKNNG